ncbi:MAG: hypothetical protein KC586_14165, partial [Myxococcales bacterium]|nr:hypothetical protein [Myxococcales bacterium]
ALPFVADELATHRVVRRLVPAFSREELAAALEQGLVLDEGGHDLVVAWLDARANELPDSLARRFAALPLFADRRGARRPLVGPTRALPRGPLEPVVPTWPWLEVEGRFAHSRGLPTPDVLALAAALCGESSWPSVPEDAIDAALRHVAAHAEELSSSRLDALARAALWRDVEGTLRPLAQLRRGGTSAALDVAFERLGERHVAAAATLDAWRALGRSAVDDRALFVGDLLARDTFDGEASLVDALLECVDLGEALEPVADLPLFLDVEGVRRPLATWSTSSARAAHRAGAHRALLEGAGVPLLDAHDESRLAPLLDALGVPAPSPTDLLRVAERLVHAPDALLALVRTHATSLDAPTLAGLARLPLVRARDGERRAANALVPPEALAPLDVATLAIDDAVADELGALGLPHRDVAEVLSDRVLARLEVGRPPPAWGVSEDAALMPALAELASRYGVPLHDLALALDDDGLLRRPPLFVASAPTRALCRAAGATFVFADPAWLEASPLGPRLTRMLPARRVVDVLREAPETVTDDLLFAWLREEGAALAADDEARALLAGVSAFPSQAGERKAPRELVLDPDVPDLGLGWGLAAHVPDDVAQWLRETFEIDRHARRAMVAQLLDGLAEA